MNKILELTKLKNSYFAMRHGESIANIEGIISSTPENGIPKYGLSNKGRQQVERSISSAKLENIFDEDTYIVSSDFKRAHESADIAQHLLFSKLPLKLDARLRERDFGDYELKSNVYYQTVWDSDALDASHTFNNVESADAVMLRVTELVLELESNFEDEVFLLVAHGDTIQILQTAFKKVSASKQREMKHLETAEIRPLILE